MTTIKILEVRLEVEGDNYEQEFARLFNEHMTKYQRLADEEHRRECANEQDRLLGDRDGSAT